MLLQVAQSTDAQIEESSNPELYEKFIECLISEFEANDEHIQF